MDRDGKRADPHRLRSRVTVEGLDQAPIAPFSAPWGGTAREVCVQQDHRPHRRPQWALRDHAWGGGRRDKVALYFLYLKIVIKRTVLVLCGC